MRCFKTCPTNTQQGLSGVATHTKRFPSLAAHVRHRWFPCCRAQAYHLAGSAV